MNNPLIRMKSCEKNYIYLPMLHRKSCNDEIINLYKQKTNIITKSYLDDIIQSDKLIMKLKEKLRKDKKEIMSKLVMENKPIPLTWINKPNYTNLIEEVFNNDHVMSRFTTHLKNAFQSRRYNDQLAIDKARKKAPGSVNEYNEYVNEYNEYINDNTLIQKSSLSMMMSNNKRNLLKWRMKDVKDKTNLSGKTLSKKELLNKSSVTNKHNDNSLMVTLKGFNWNLSNKSNNPRNHNNLGSINYSHSMLHLKQNCVM